jgi:hypothetical protein
VEFLGRSFPRVVAEKCCRLSVSSVTGSTTTIAVAASSAAVSEAAIVSTVAVIISEHLQFQ